MWVGQVVHEIIEYVLKKFRDGEILSLDDSMSILRKKLDSGYTQSKLKEYSGFSSKLNKLFEHEYGIEITKNEKQRLFEFAGQCLMNFYNSDIFAEIKNTPKDDWLLLEDFLRFDFEGETVFLSIDFALKKEGKIILYDWKTGKERTSDFDLQMMLYSLYVKKRWGIGNENIVARVFNVSIDKVDNFVVNCDKLESAKNYMRRSIQKMKSKLVFPDYNQAREEDFKKVHLDSGYKYPCNRCNFRKICKL